MGRGSSSTAAIQSALLANATRDRNTAEFCAIANQDCLCPAGHGVNSGVYVCGEDDPKTRGRCYVCGNPACANCSTVREYCGGPHRICNSCEEEQFPDGAAQVLLRTYHRNGYPDRTLESVQRELAAQARN